MKKVRIIPRLDIKGPNVIKGIHLEGLRVVGKPAQLARKYYEQGADEILYIDIVASLYERENILEVIKETVSLGVFIPITVGGGIRTIEDIQQILRAGADKVAINTAAVKNPNFIKEASNIFGSQCIIGSIEAKKTGDSWEIYTENGREKTGIDAIKWAQKLVELGAGELIITSIDNEGTGKGYDTELIKNITSLVSVPVIACGGAGKIDHIKQCLKETNCDAISLASLLHYNRITINEIKNNLSSDFPLRLQYSTKDFKPNKNKKTVSIIDYGLGNLMSVKLSFEKVGNKTKIVSTPGEILSAESLVLPGVGAFKDGMDGLKKRGLIEAIKRYSGSGKPFLGICLGTQLFLSQSEEFGINKGLNLIPGKVIKFKDPKRGDRNYRVPHMGWNTIKSKKSWKGSILEWVGKEPEVYFVHSFFPVPKNNEDILATTNYGSQEFTSLIKKGNIYGCQFHPEKSGEIGLRILKSFGEL